VIIINRQESPDEARKRLLLEAEAWWKEPDEIEWRGALTRAGIPEGRQAQLAELPWSEVPQDVKNELCRALDDGRRDWRNSGTTLGEMKYGRGTRK
jgi:hypothetical protein